MAAKRRICRTKFIEGGLDGSIATYLFKRLKDGVVWHEGIRSRRSPGSITRKAFLVSIGDELYFELLPYVSSCLEKLTDVKYVIEGIYINYYETGNMYTPNHSHKGTHQLVISLGGTRTLMINKKAFPMKNGDIILFGSSTHGVPKEDAAEPRISIATFMKPVYS